MVGDLPSFLNLTLIVGKALAIFGLLIYLIFALVVIQQVRLMTKTVQFGIEWFMMVLAFTHFLFALGVLILAFVIL